MSRSSLLVFVLTLVLGLGAGAYVGWVVAPAPNPGAGLPTLQQTYKDDYVLMIAAAFAQDQDAAAARARLSALGEADAASVLAGAAQRLVASGAAEADLRRLAQLTSALGAVPPALEVYLP
jgi:hypothetical protein